MEQEFLNKQEKEFLKQIESSLNTFQGGDIVQPMNWTDLRDLEVIATAYIQENLNFISEQDWWDNEIVKEIALMDKDELLRMLKFLEYKKRSQKNSPGRQVEERILRSNIDRFLNENHPLSIEDNHDLQNARKQLLHGTDQKSYERINQLLVKISELFHLKEGYFERGNLELENQFNIVFEYPEDVKVEEIENHICEFALLADKSYREFGGSGLKIDIKNVEVPIGETVVN